MREAMRERVGDTRMVCEWLVCGRHRTVGCSQAADGVQNSHMMTLCSKCLFNEFAQLYLRRISVECISPHALPNHATTRVASS